MKTDLLPGFDLTDAEWVSEMPLDERLNRACELLQKAEPPEGFHLAFSGGKDSCAIKKIAEISGVKFKAVYNSTTIDPPELVRFIKEFHKDVEWNLPKQNMMHRVANAPKVPPTRKVRWCCEEYKEHGGEGLTRIVGVRAAESKRRARLWSEITKHTDDGIIVCPIVHWLDDQVWEFLRDYKIPYCSLYDEGFERLGCVGCMLASKDQQRIEFDRWPAYERNWKKAIVSNWEKWHAVPTKKGKPRFQSRFKSGEELWQWWLENKKTDDSIACQNEMLFTNF